jgi:tetratricopeptide (TPR) repeat protein
LVITIDSAMAHLAGALGKPTWLLDRFDNEWRWLTGRQDSPWYPSLRIFRQSSLGDWDGVLSRVKDALAELAPPRAIEPRPLTSQPTSAAQTRMPTVTAPTQTNLSVEQALQLAGQHQSAGRLPQAEGLLRQILQVQPEHVQARHLLGVVLYQAGHAQAAIELISQVVAKAPNVALFHSNLAEMCRQQQLLDKAIQHGERAVALDPSMASAHSNLGIAYYDAAQHEQARACHERALALNPRLLQSLNNLGSIARALKDSDAAVAWYRQALAIQPDYLEALSNLGAVLVEGDGFEAAAEPLEHALRLHPHYAEALCNLGLLRLKQERIDEAVHLLQQCLQRRPGYPEALVGLALALHDKDDLASAHRLLREVVSVQPHRGDAWCHLGTVCQELGDIAEAERAYDKALAIDPRSADALTGLGNLRLEQGKMDEAEKLLRQAIGHDDSHLPARFHLVQVRKVKPGDDNLADLERRLTDAGALGTDRRISLHYALGKAYDDLREWDKAFPHFIEGARLKRAKFTSYDPASEAARIDRIIETVDSRFLRRLGGHGHASDLPVFVLGMPRSGTTLTEQIIASHPQVHGAGELGDLMTIVQRQLSPGLGLAFPHNLAQLTPEALGQWGQDYVHGLRQRAPHARRITDKMPSNYLAMGLIPLMLPHARIIHVRRNPMDTCVSCFTRLFNRHQEATYDLYELGRHYANYARLMDHWRAVLPTGSFMEVQYEEIVADMPQQARRLLDFVGLPWDDACLAFHQTERVVRTASVTQVRQPIYTSSVERWRHYERYLTPLLQGLGDLAPR